ncbi:MAG: hypothetical protein LRY39_00180 [Alphaproteobacteria bacterium]|nr:hypothetical protein [Alphaproteobacteria bacterium]
MVVLWLYAEPSFSLKGFTLSVSLFAPSRTVLMIADEGLYIYTSGSRGVRLIDIVPWEQNGFESRVSDILVKDCGSKPVMILNDMVEQYYRKERVPKVGMMDKANVVKRKLQVAFPNYPARAALELKEKVKPSASAKSGSIYIFAAVPGTESYTKTLAAVTRSLCSIAGFGLLPIESSDLVKTVSASLTPRGRKKAVWAMMLGQHKNGGLRQIVTKNGELALTRMTPVMDSDSDPNLWAREVYQEFKATMSYLTRFGFSPEDGLDVITIATQQAGEILADMIDVECNFHALSVQQVARHAGVSIGSQDSGRYADPLHVAWAGRKSRLILPMKTPEIEAVSGPRQMAMVGTLVLFVAAGFQGYQLMNAMDVIQSVSDDLGVAQSRQLQLTAEYDQEVARKKALGFDIELVQAAVELHTALEKNDLHYFNLVEALGRGLGRDLRMDNLKIEHAPPFSEATDNSAGAAFNDDGTAPPAQGKPLYTLSFQMTFPSTTNIDRGNKEVADLRDRLAALLPGHTVNVDKYLKDYEFVDELVVETGEARKKDVSQDFVASIRIEGPRS